MYTNQSAVNFTLIFNGNVPIDSVPLGEKYLSSTVPDIYPYELS